jgi:hypothetical protein
MATVGLRVVGGGDQTLADTLAKGIFGDPEAEIKARLMASQVQAHNAYATKLGADTALVNLKTQEEQALENARNAAAGPAGAAFAAGVPQPVPVVPVRPTDYLTPDQGTIVSGTSGDVTTAPPAIVTPEARNRYNLQKQALSAAGPLIVRMGDNPNATIESIGKGFGLGGLLGAQAGNPGADAGRISSELYTGKTPDVNDVTTAGDLAGVNAGTGQKIAVEQAKAAAEAAKPPGVLKLGENERAYSADPNNPGGYIPTPGVQQPGGQDAGPYGKTNEGVDLNTVLRLNAKSRDPNAAFTPQEADQYNVAYGRLYGEKHYIETNAQGQKFDVMIPAVTPQGFIPPATIMQRAGVAPAAPQPAPPAAPAPAGQPPTPAPAGGPPAPAATPPGGATVTPLGPEFNVSPPATEAQARDQFFAGSAAQASQPMDRMGPNDVPGNLSAYLAIPSVSGESLLAQVGRSTLLSEADKTWMANALQFTAAINYKISGAAVNPDEWASARLIYIPMPGDSPKILAEKAARRDLAVQGMSSSGFSSNPKGLQDFNTKWGRGARPAGGPAPAAGGPAPTPAPAASNAPPPGVPQNVWEAMTPQERAAFGR